MSPTVLSALLMGLFGGVHCVAMCGGVVGVLCAAAPSCRAATTSAAGGRSRAPYWLAYHGGRVGSYALLGLAFGSFGSLPVGAAPLEALRFALRAVAAVCMLSVGLHLAGFPSVVRAIEGVGAPVWARLAPLTKRVVPLRSHWGALLLGGVWGLMPCGLLYAALALAASAGSPLLGAATMTAFGVGTLPVMVTMSAIAQSVAGWVSRPWVRRLAGSLVFAFGLWSAAGVASQAGLGAVFGLSPRHACCPTRG